MVYLESKDGSRYYAIVNLQYDLFSEHVVCVRYGHRGYPGHSFYRYFDEPDAKKKYVQRLLDMRFKHGYHIVKND